MPDGAGSTQRAWAPGDGATVTVLDPLAHEARDCFREMARSLEEAALRVGPSFGRAVRALREVQGHVVVTGLGKSGLIGRKIAATFTSTGTPSFFLHSAEAFHGDLGAITGRDAVVLISYSGETTEVAGLLPHLKARGVPTIALVGNPDSTVGRGADVTLDVSVEREVCPNNLAPTSSAVTTHAMGEALAVSLIRLRGFDAEDFARLHPGGSLGRRLSRVREAMSRELLTTVQVDATAKDCALALARSHVPMALVLDGSRLRGVVGEAELQSALEGGSLDAPVTDFMNREPAVVPADALVADAEERMRGADLPALVVVDEGGRVVGLLPAR